MDDKTLTYSSMKCFKECRREYYYRYVQGIEVKKKPDYFIIGSAVDLGLNLFYQNEKIDKVFTEINNYFQSKMPVEFDSMETQIKWEKAHVLSVDMVKNYIETYQDEKFEVLEIQKSFKIEVPGTDYSLAGKIDGIVKQDSSLWILENKTTKSVDSNYLKKLTLDQQSIIYKDAYEKETKKKIAGILHNVLIKSVPALPKLLKNGTLSMAPSSNKNVTVETFLAACRIHGLDPNDYRIHLEWLKKNQRSFFYREWLVFPQETMDEWRNELKQIVKDIDNCQKEKTFYKNTSSCVQFGVCPYFDICTAIDKEAVIEASYIRLKDKLQELK